MKELKINFLLAITAVILSAILFPVGILFSLITLKLKVQKLSKYFIKIGLGIDQLGTVIMGPLFNKILITSEGYTFDDEDDTISYVLGRNKMKGTLKFTGKILVNILEWIDKDHCEKAVKLAWEKGRKYCSTEFQKEIK